MALQLGGSHAGSHFREHGGGSHGDGATVAFPGDRLDGLLAILQLVREHHAQVDFVAAGGVVLVVIGACVAGGYLYKVLATALLRMLQNDFLVQGFKRHGVLLPSVGMSENSGR